MRKSLIVGRGAFCGLIMVSLLNLPLELPSTAAANVSGQDTFLTGLPEYLSRCKSSSRDSLRGRIMNGGQVKPTKAESPAPQETRHMEHMPSARWPAFVPLANPRSC
jgi:hypothetical protein